MIKFNPLPSIERLNELLEVVEIPPDKYGEWSGLVWKINRQGHVKAGDIAGTKRVSESRIDWKVKIKGVYYFVSRIIYYMVYKQDPGFYQVDHKNKNSLDNNVTNLRLDVNGDIQSINQPKRRDNTSGVVGVCWSNPCNKWVARVKIKNKRISLGYFDCKLEATRAIINAWLALEWDKLGRELPDVDKVACDCLSCSSISTCPSDPAE